MGYELVLSEPRDETRKDVGENVFIHDLPSDYAVYLFYYPGAIPNKDLESKLRDLGNITGKNLFVNIGRLNDPNYQKIANTFDIKNLPVIIVTAIDRFASPPTEFLTAYVRMDNKRLLNSPDLVIQCLQRLFNLFIQGEISDAMSQAAKDKRDVLICRLKAVVSDALKGIWEFLKHIEISVCLVTGRFAVKYSGG